MPIACGQNFKTDFDQLPINLETFYSNIMHSITVRPMLNPPTKHVVSF